MDKKSIADTLRDVLDADTSSVTLTAEEYEAISNHAEFSSTNDNFSGIIYGIRLTKKEGD